MTANTNVNGQVADLVSQIKAEEAKIRLSDMEWIVQKVCIGGLLTALKQARKEEHINWEEWVEAEFGYHRREASRLMCIHEHWGDVIGTGGADEVLPHLPDDTQKLEWLCRLPLDDLRELVQTIDCRRHERKEVVQAVKDRLGVPMMRDIWAKFRKPATKILAKLTPERRVQARAALRADVDELLGQQQDEEVPAATQAATEEEEEASPEPAPAEEDVTEPANEMEDEPQTEEEDDEGDEDEDPDDGLDDGLDDEDLDDEEEDLDDEDEDLDDDEDDEDDEPDDDDQDLTRSRSRRR